MSPSSSVLSLSSSLISSSLPRLCEGKGLWFKRLPNPTLSAGVTVREEVKEEDVVGEEEVVSVIKMTMGVDTVMVRAGIQVVVPMISVALLKDVCRCRIPLVADTEAQTRSRIRRLG